MDQNIDNNEAEIISELEQCREDERNSQNQVIQVIVTAGTILALIFGISSFQKKYVNILFHMSNLVLCTTICYITSLGISAVLRYHYIRNLEDELAKIGGEHHKRIIHWNSFSSSITTKNPLHMYNIYTKMNYACYSISTVCPILFCVVITSFQYFSINEKCIFDVGGIITLSLVMFLAVVVYFVSSVKAPTMYKKAIEISSREQEKRCKHSEMNTLSDGENRIELGNILKVMVYFIYPKKKDAQKMILVLFGFLTGSFLKRGTYLLTRDDLSNMLIICFVVEFLIYQARYQWNDIRGVEEDQSEQKSNRLPVKILGKYAAIFFHRSLL